MAKKSKRSVARRERKGSKAGSKSTARKGGSTVRGRGVAATAKRKPSQAKPKAAARKPSRAKPKAAARKPSRAKPKAAARKPSRTKPKAAARKPAARAARRRPAARAAGTPAAEIVYTDPVKLALERRRRLHS